MRKEYIVCDCCKKEYTDTQEIQEFLSFSDSGGYSNFVFGDGTMWSIDLCQYCVKEKLGEYVQISGNYITGE